jgi:hypothetical protein
VAKKEHEKRYTHPDMREQIKEEIEKSDKGGNPGEWSARKSQLLTQEYERRGGGYRAEKSDEQKDLERWTDEDWQTREGDADARDKESGETSRYLPKEAWEKMSEEEKRATEEKKREGSREGEQHVENTGAAKKARERSRAAPIEDYDTLTVEEVEEKLKGLSKDEIRTVRKYEKNHENRKTLIEAMDRKL